MRTPSAETSSSRSLKIEAHVEGWKSLAKPKIRLMGRWLERAGFIPGGRVEIMCLSPGVIELRAVDKGGSMGS
jgi:hypothetical protein